MSGGHLGGPRGVQVGDAVPPFVVERVSPENIKIFALLLQDSNPIHFDQAAVRAAGLGDREVNQGGATLAYLYDMLIAWTGSATSIVRVSCQFRGNVFAGDRVECGGRVAAVETSEDWHVVECEVWADTDRGVRAIRGSATAVVSATPRE